MTDHAHQLALVLTGDVQWRFFNSPEQPSISGNFAMAPGATRDDSLEMMREMQRATEAVGAAYEAEYGLDPVTFVMTEIGGNTGRGLSGTESKDPDQLGAISIELVEVDARPYSSSAFVAKLQEEVQHHPLAETVSFRGWRSGPGGDALDVQFSGADAPTLKAASEDLKTALAEAMPEGPWHFPEDQVSDVSQRLLATEITREQIYRQLHAELPYASAVDSEQYKERPDGSVEIHQQILVARDSQKAIMLGKQGTRIKAIGEASRKELSKLLGVPVHLYLHVKVKENWDDSRELFENIGLDWVD